MFSFSHHAFITGGYVNFILLKRMHGLSAVKIISANIMIFIDESQK